MADTVDEDAWAGAPSPISETSRVSITRGMANAMVRGGMARKCSECGLGFPRYRGRYPTACPTCGGPIELCTPEDHAEPDADDVGGMPDGDADDESDEKLGESTLDPHTLAKGQRVKVNAEEGNFTGTVSALGKLSVTVSGDKGGSATLIQNARNEGVWTLIVGSEGKAQKLGRVTDVVTERVEEAAGSPESRVRQMSGRGWWARSFGSDDYCPAPFPTKGAAVEWCKRNEEAVKTRGVTDADEAAVVAKLAGKPSKKLMALSKIMSQVNKDNEPPGGWSDADRVGEAKKAPGVDYRFADYFEPEAFETHNGLRLPTRFRIGSAWSGGKTGYFEKEGILEKLENEYHNNPESVWKIKGTERASDGTVEMGVLWVAFRTDLGRDEGVLPVVAVSLVPRLQKLIEAGTPSPIMFEGDEARSRAVVVSFEVVETAVPGGVQGLELFLEGPVGESTYFRLEGPMDPVLIFEVNRGERSVTIYATESPAAAIGFDPREQLVGDSVYEADEYDAAILGESQLDEVGETPPSAGEALSYSPTAGYILSPRSSGATRAHGGFRFRIGANRNRKPKHNLAQAIQNRRNAKRGLASRIRAAKKWHRGVSGDELHKALGRYNTGNRRGEAVTTAEISSKADAEARNEAVGSDTLDAMKMDITFPMFSFKDRSRAVMFAKEIVSKLGYTAQRLHVPSDGTVTVVDARARERMGYRTLLSTAQRYGGAWSGVKDTQGNEVDHFVYGPWNESVTGLESSTEKLDIDLPPSLAMPRDEMPQVEPLYDFLEYLRGLGIVVNTETVAVKTLHGSQDVDPAKVKKMAGQDIDTLRAPIVVSNDGFILDGHHRWAALYYLGPLNQIETYRVMLPFSALLALAKDWDGATYKQVGEAVISEAHSTLMAGVAERSVDDIFDALLRRLVVIESTDVLEDVEFTDRGSIYLFFDPSLSPAEVDEIMRALQSEEPGLTLIASPDMSLPGETATSDWWVTFLSGKTAEGDEPVDPSMYASEAGTPGQAAANQMVKTKDTTLDAIAASVDTSKLVQAAAAKDAPKADATAADAAPPTETTT